MAGEDYRAKALEALEDLKEVASVSGPYVLPLSDSSLSAYVNLVTMWATLAIMTSEDTWLPEA